MADAQRLVELFKEANRLAGEEKAAFVARVREEDSALANSLNELLKQEGPVPTEPGSFVERTKDQYGSEADPHITLEGSGEADSDFISEIIQRLAGRGQTCGRYRLKGEVARGGQGVILRVWDEDLRRNLAMKVVLGKSGQGTGETPRVDSKTLGRFLEEAQVTGQLDHPGIVPVHELGLDSEGQVYFTMKLVKGRDLKAIFDLVHEAEERWTQTRALNVLLKVCEAMAYAHAKGVIHRDLKPGNVMVGRYGEVYVMDWGLARVLGRLDERDLRVRPPTTTTQTSEVRSDRKDAVSDDSPIVTMDGDVVGTPAYMSPEQASGDLEAMGPPSDVYAVGAMLYHLLTGHMPYVQSGVRANNYAIWTRVQEGPPNALHAAAPNAPEELVAICERAMAREPAQRYADMEALALDLRAFLENRVVSAYEAGAVAELRKWVVRNNGLAGSMAAGLLLLIAGLVTSWILKSQSDENAARAVHMATKAHDAQTAAEHALSESRWQTYVASIRATGVSLESGNWGAARQSLDRCPEEHRNWEWRHLDLRCGNVRAVLPTGSVASSAISEDGLRIVTGAEDGRIRLWNGETGELIRTFEGHEDTVLDLALESESGLIVSSSKDGTLRLWDIDSGQVRATLKGHTGPVHCLALGHDSRILSGGADGSVRLWDAASGAEVNSWNGHAEPVRIVGWTPDARRFFSCSEDRTILLWDTDSAEHITTFEFSVARDSWNGAAIHWSGDGRLLAIPQYSGTVDVVDTVDARVVASLRLPNFSNWIERIAMDRGGRRLFAADLDSGQLWDIESGSELASVEGGPYRFTDYPKRSVAFQADGRSVVLCRDREIDVMDVLTGEEVDLGGFQDEVEWVEVSLDGGTIVSGSRSEIRLWASTHLARPLFLANPPGGPVPSLEDLAFSRDGRFIIGVCSDAWIQVWDGRSGVPLRPTQPTGGRNRWPLDADREMSPEGPGYAFWMLPSRIASEGGVVLTQSADGERLRVRDIDTGNDLRSLRLPVPSIRAGLEISSDARRAVSVDEGVMTFWDCEAGRALAEVDGSDVDEIDISQDGLWAACVRGDSLLEVWDVTTGTLRAEHRTPLEYVSALEVDSVHGLALLGGRFGDLCVIDIDSGETLSRFRAHDRAVGIVMCSPDGSRLISTGEDGIRVSSLREGEPLLLVQVSDWHRITGLAVSPDGRRIAAAIDGKGVVVLDSDRETARKMREGVQEYAPDSLLDKARARIEEWLVRQLHAAKSPHVDPTILIYAASFLLTVEPVDLRDPEAALELAERAHELDGHEDYVFSFQTLARAYHETGDTAMAIESQTRAIQNLSSDARDASPEPKEFEGRREELKQQLAEYETALSLQTSEPRERD